MSHEEIARRLREQGMTEAPPELRDEVMRAVRAEPHPRPSTRRRRPPWPILPAWRPVAVWVGVAACLLAAGAGISRLGGGGSSSSAGSSAAAGQLAVRGVDHRLGAPLGTTTLLFGSVAQARSVLGDSAYSNLHLSADGAYQSAVPPTEYYAITHRYAMAGLSATKATPTSNAPGVRIRVLLRVRAP